MQIKFSKPNSKLHKAKVHINPDLYWQIIILCSVVVAILGAVFGFYLFGQVNKEFNLLDVNTGKTSERIKKDRLDNALGHFELRETRSQDILDNPAPIVDPSL